MRDAAREKPDRFELPGFQALFLEQSEFGDIPRGDDEGVSPAGFHRRCHLLDDAAAAIRAVDGHIHQFQVGGDNTRKEYLAQDFPVSRYFFGSSPFSGIKRYIKSQTGAPTAFSRPIPVMRSIPGFHSETHPSSSTTVMPSTDCSTMLRNFRSLSLSARRRFFVR